MKSTILILIAGFSLLLSTGCQKEELAIPQEEEFSYTPMIPEPTELFWVDIESLPDTALARAHEIMTQDTITTEDMAELVSLLEDHNIELPGSPTFGSQSPDCEGCVTFRVPAGWGYQFSAWLAYPNWWINYYDIGYCVFGPNYQSCAPYGGW